MIGDRLAKTFISIGRAWWIWLLAYVIVGGIGVALDQHHAVTWVYGAYIAFSVLLCIALVRLTVAYADWCERRYRARVQRLVGKIRRDGV